MIIKYNSFSQSASLIILPENRANLLLSLYCEQSLWDIMPLLTRNHRMFGAWTFSGCALGCLAYLAKIFLDQPLFPLKVGGDGLFVDHL